MCKTKPVLVHGITSSCQFSSWSEGVCVCVCVCMFSTNDVMCTLDWHAGALLSVNTSECARAVYYTSATTPVVFLQRERGFTRTLPSMKEKVGASGVTPPSPCVHHSRPFPSFSYLSFAGELDRQCFYTLSPPSLLPSCPSLSSLPLSLSSLPLLSPSPLSLSSLPFQMAMG